MRSRELVLAALLVAAVPALPAAEAPTRLEVELAAAQVREHPDLGGMHKKKTLKLRETGRKETPRESSWKWLADFVQWVAGAARVLVWLTASVLVALLLVGLRRWVLVRRGTARLPSLVFPSHVQSLDIRPESLPAAIGEAAALLWQRGEHRAALSLLYRGALSRLVHAHAVPIRAASTEGECVELAVRRLDGQRSAYFARLVGAWQLAVYGARLPDAPHALALCQDFDVHLATPPQGAPA